MRNMITTCRFSYFVQCVRDYGGSGEGVSLSFSE